MSILLLLREIIRNRKSFIIWTLSMVVMIVMMMAFYPTIADKSKVIDDLIKTYPKEMLAAFNMDKLSLSDILGYFGTETYIFLVLFGSIYAMLLFSGIISKEESDKTIEFLLAKPITRNTIVTSKILCAVVYIALFNIILSITGYIMLETLKRKPFSMEAFLLLSVGPLLVQLTFASIGLFVSIFIVKAKSIYPISLGVVLGMYFVSILSGLSDKTRNLKYLTLFKYADSADLIINKRIEWYYLVIMFSVIALMTAATYIFYNKKNITV